MPVYLFTYHAYRSWMPDRPRGFVQKRSGLQPTNIGLAKSYANASVYPPFIFSKDVQQTLLETVREICQRRQWHVHGLATETTHLHAIISWRSPESWQDVRGKLRNLLSLTLSRRSGEVGRPWFSQGSSRKQVRDRAHFEHLLRVYFRATAA